MKHLVKRNGRTEPFDPRKVYASIYAVGTLLRLSTAEIELIADRVTKTVETWAADKSHVTSYDIFRTASRELKKYNPDAGFLYAAHRDIC